ncbi:hypothetical protein [Amycolatopsis kentuckyensis]|uniref:hypothetical protein n=1 Tax=Amycolatopsis kentuckyensis TaxID=218823 RepID=UPI0035622159
MPELVLAQHEETGHVAELSDEGLKFGMHPGWVAINGLDPEQTAGVGEDPVPARPEVAGRKKPAGKAPEESADTESAEK